MDGFFASVIKGRIFSNRVVAFNELSVFEESLQTIQEARVGAARDLNMLPEFAFGYCLANPTQLAKGRV